MSGPLYGVRVLDLTSMISGPLATMLLADQGADVIKVENPRGGDLNRHVSTARNGMSASFLNNNRNKRSLVVDLKDERGVRALKALARTADVLVQNFRPGVVERLGIGPDDLRAEAPGLVYVSIFGFGDRGPYARKPVYDPLIQAVSGLASVQGGSDSERPRLVRTIVPDKLTGHVCAQAVTAALYHKAKTGEGQTVVVKRRWWRTGWSSRAPPRTATRPAGRKPRGARHERLQGLVPLWRDHVRGPAGEADRGPDRLQLLDLLEEGPGPYSGRERRARHPLWRRPALALPVRLDDRDVLVLSEMRSRAVPPLARQPPALLGQRTLPRRLPLHHHLRPKHPREARSESVIERRGDQRLPRRTLIGPTKAHQGALGPSAEPEHRAPEHRAGVDFAPASHRTAFTSQSLDLRFGQQAGQRLANTNKLDSGHGHPPDRLKLRNSNLIRGRGPIQVLVSWPITPLSEHQWLHALLGVETESALLGHPKSGAFWEGFAMHEIVRLLEVDWDRCHYWATHRGAELDLLVHNGGRRIGFEFKRSGP